MALDTIIRDALVYPGLGPPRRVEVGLAGDEIAVVAPEVEVEAGEVVDGTDLILCPGFVDMHAHSALRPFADPILAPKIAQGFTTELLHPDGLAPAPVDPARVNERRDYLMGLEGAGPEVWSWSSMNDYLDALERTRPTTTLVPSAGHNSVRDRVMGGGQRAPTARELGDMRSEVRAALEAGARTVSFGLIYLPGAYAETPELIALAEEAARFGAPLVPHIRNESHGVLDALTEMVTVARSAGAPLHISHLKSRASEALIEPMLELLDAASADIDLSFDQYPYGAGSTVLSALLPPWAHDGGASETLARLRDPGDRARIARDVARPSRDWEHFYAVVGPARITIANTAADRSEFIGMSLEQAGQRLGIDPIEAALTLLEDCRLDVTMVSHYASEEAVRKIAGHRLHLVGSDGIFGAKPHPRLYGTAPRFLGRFSMREGLVPVEEAVARLTARAARRLGLRDRGEIAPGMRADLVLLDPETYVDTASYDDPQQYPTGVDRVWVGGQVVWQDGAATGARPGAVIRERRS